MLAFGFPVLPAADRLKGRKLPRPTAVVGWDPRRDLDHRYPAPSRHFRDRCATGLISPLSWYYPLLENAKILT